MGHPNNIAVLSGTITNEPTSRSLAAGVDVVNFDLSTVCDSANVSVPIAWYDPRPASLASIVAGEEVVVIGTVRRRFFRVGGQTQSRTEVVVDTLVPLRRAKSARSALMAAADALTRGCE